METFATSGLCVTQAARSRPATEFVTSNADGTS